MEKVRIEKTQKTPLFILENGYIRLSGHAIPQNARQMFNVCFDWVEEYVKSPAQETKVDLFFEYINTASIRCIADILITLSKITENSSNALEINWYYENNDDDSYDLGSYLQTNMDVPFNFITLEEGEDIPAG